MVAAIWKFLPSLKNHHRTDYRIIIKHYRADCGHGHCGGTMCPAGPQEAQNEPGHPEASEGLGATQRGGYGDILGEKSLDFLGLSV